MVALRARASAVGAAFVAAAVVLSGALAPAAVAAETVGGEQLSSPHRTVSLLPGADPLPEVWAKTWILADMTTGDVLAQKGSHIQRPPASTLKMLTALTVLANTSPQDTYVATKRAAGIYGARVGLKPGRSYTLDELWYAVFLPSANDAAIAVAEANGGVHRTVRQMQETATGLGALDTVVRNTSGLDARGQLSSAYDLALIARAGLARDDFATYASTKKAQFPDVKGKGRHPIFTTNRLLLHGYDGMIGVKTGFTSKAGRTYVGAATRNGRTFLVALMGIREASETAAKKLLTWGFRNSDKVTPVGRLVDPGEIDATVGGNGAAVGTSAVATNRTTDSGKSSESATTAAAEPTTTSSVPLGVLVLIAVVGGSVLLVVVARRHRRPRGRHAA